MYKVRQDFYKFYKSLKSPNLNQFCQKYSNHALKSNKNVRKMKGWQIHSYGDIDELQYSDKTKFPIIKNSTDVLVKVISSGVNPIDVAMIGGYGSKFLNVLRCNNQNDIEFPLTFGREFCGTVTQKGMGCSENVKVGDTVWGVVPVHHIGSHAEYVVAPEACISKKPQEISNIEAGGVLYAGLTAWSGLFISGLLGDIQGAFTSNGGGRGKHVLVLGASGGVGSSAVQILKSENVSVVGSCSTDAISLVKELGADHVIDYTNQTQISEFSTCGPYDIILDCAGLGQKYAESFGWSYGSYITFSSPLLKNVDDNGLLYGMIKNVADIININAKSVCERKGLIKWGYFVPSAQGIQYLGNLVSRKKLLPLIDSVYKFNDVKEAYKKVKNGHLRGKVIIDMQNQS